MQFYILNATAKIKRQGGIELKSYTFIVYVNINILSIKLTGDNH